MDVMDSIKQRRSIRRYKLDPIPADVLERLLETLRLAPSASNRQAWRFVVVQDTATRQKLAQAFRFTTAPDKVHTQLWVAQAPVIIVACGLKKEAAASSWKDGEPFMAKGEIFVDEHGQPTWEFNMVHWDLAIALDHFSLAAMAEGLGTCWIGGLHQPDVKAILGVPDDVTAELAMTVGYADGNWPSARPRKAFDEVIGFERY